MSVLSDNMRYLRAQLNFSQQKVADNLIITRGRYAKYEDGASEPPIEILLKISKYFKISIDLLVSIDIRKYPLEEIIRLPDNRIVLPIKVDTSGENRIEIIPHKASMGYLSGYSDPEYIESLQQIHLPFLSSGKYRAFPAGGDSMPPFRDGTFIVGKYLETPDDLKRNKTYIFVTRNEGIVYKRFVKRLDHGIHVSSDNTFYEPYEIPLADLLEIWEYACSISTEEFEPEHFSSSQITRMISELKTDLKRMEKKFLEK